MFEESETIEILAATGKEKRAEINKLQKVRNFRQIATVQKQFCQDVTTSSSDSGVYGCSMAKGQVQMCGGGTFLTTTFHY